ncbi:CDP-glycerol glycerophosphotransferase family protein [Flavobacterium sp. W21_SRS_FM6]|uniref:CDP-glycerol glycerophosphotransferase family protein n=1 Tax=Flavobacterium sp. W21_SRS_FM6 TaxID=3240268 RepID=UPI003F912818
MNYYLFYVVLDYSFEILRPLQQEILKRGDDVAWFVEGIEVDMSKFHPEERVLSSVEEVIKFDPIAVFVPGNTVPSFIPGLKVQVFHGFEWKKKGHYRIRDCFDLYCTQGPLFTEEFNKIRANAKSKHFEIKETGWPKIDTLFNAPAYEWSDKRPVPTLLYAPTFSPAFTSAPDLYEEIKRLAQDKKWQWIVKFHPKMPEEWIEKFRELTSDNIHIVDIESLASVLQAADVIISDTSSIITEFALLNRPIVTYRNSVPEPHLIDIQEAKALEQAIERALTPSDAQMKKIQENVAKLHPYRDGHSSTRVLEATLDLINRGITHLDAKPSNIIREFKMRMKLSYWRF